MSTRTSKNVACLFIVASLNEFSDACNGQRWWLLLAAKVVRRYIKVVSSVPSRTPSLEALDGDMFSVLLTAKHF